MPKYSIIIPVYNAERYIDECLSSILNQNFNDYEIILINDGSTDKSSIICKKYADKYTLIRYFNKYNEGVSATRNYGIDKANGKYIIFIDSDDVIEKNFLSVIDNDIKNNDFLIYGYYKMYCNKKIKYKLETTINKEQLKKLIYTDEKISGYLWNKVFRADVILNNKLKFNTKIHYSEDLLFIDDYMEFVNNFYIESQCLYNYRMRKNSVTFDFYNKKNVSSLEALDNLIEKNHNNEIIYNHLVYCYLKNYYRLKEIIKEMNYNVNEDYFKIEKEILCRRNKQEKYLYYLSKYNYRLYLFMKKIKQKKDKLFD